MWLFKTQLITFSPSHTGERARRCLSLEFKECVQPGVTVCRVSVWGWLSLPPSLLLFLMGNLEKLREPLFQTQRKRMKESFHVCDELSGSAALGKFVCWPQEVIRICSLPPYRLYLYGCGSACRCVVHIIFLANCTLSLDQFAVHAVTVKTALQKHHITSPRAGLCS